MMYYLIAPAVWLAIMLPLFFLERQRRNRIERRRAGVMVDILEGRYETHIAAEAIEIGDCVFIDNRGMARTWMPDKPLHLSRRARAEIEARNGR